jgi:HSP20 family protein
LKDPDKAPVNKGPLPGTTKKWDPAIIVTKKGEVNSMVRWYYRSIFDELEDMRKYMESLSRQMSDTSPMVLLPSPALSTIKMLPKQRDVLYVLRVDVANTKREVVVTADMIPGVLKKDITLTLIDPVTLRISCERRDENREEKDGYFLWERTFGSMIRIIPLPRAVSEEGSRASFREGILEIHLKKSEKETKGKIPID